jgi:SAM-dependent methyltransferase
VKAILSGSTPAKKVIATDVSDEAIASSSVGEGIFRTELDGTIACPSYDIDRPDSSVDLVFCFQAAHHFGAHRRTLIEVNRILRPGGTCLYLHEPTTPAYLYKVAVSRVNRKRSAMGHNVVEDVIVGDKLIEIAEEAGFSSTRLFAASLGARGEKAMLYYGVVRKLGPVQRFIPSCADFKFVKPAQVGTAA